jgi:hypothetical protein
MPYKMQPVYAVLPVLEKAPFITYVVLKHGEAVQHVSGALAVFKAVKETPKPQPVRLLLHFAARVLEVAAG